MKKSIILICLFVFIGVSATAQNTDSAYKQKVIHLMKIRSGQSAVMDNMIEKMSASIPEKNKPAFKKEIHEKLEGLYREMADVFMNVYSKKEIDAMLNFYNSPIGQKIQKKLPVFMEKSTELGKKFSQQLMPVMQKYMQQ